MKWLNYILGSLFIASILYILIKSDSPGHAIIKTDTVTNTITEKHYIHPRGLYAWAQIDSKGIVAPSLMYMKNRYAFTAGYSITTQSILIGGFIKLGKPP